MVLDALLFVQYGCNVLKMNGLNGTSLSRLCTKLGTLKKWCTKLEVAR